MASEIRTVLDLAAEFERLSADAALRSTHAEGTPYADEHRGEWWAYSRAARMARDLAKEVGDGKA